MEWLEEHLVQDSYILGQIQKQLLWEEIKLLVSLLKSNKLMLLNKEKNGQKMLKTKLKMK